MIILMFIHLRMIPQDINIKSLLENMSDEEINNYLRENSDPGENTKGI